MKNYNFTVGKFRLEDGFKELLTNCYGEYLCNPEIDRVKSISLLCREIIQFSKENENTCFCLYEDNKIRGFIGFQQLDWDSKHFGFKVAAIKYLIADGSAENILIINELSDLFDNWCRLEQVRLAYARPANNDIDYIHCLESVGFRYLENRLHLYLPKSKFKKPEARKGIEIVDFSPEHSEKILSLVPDALKISRFHKDPLTKEKADAVYLNWAGNALEDSGKKKLVMKVNGKFAGFFFYYLRDIKELSQRSLWWDLTILSPEFRGKGLGHYFYAYIADKEKDQVDFAEGKFSLSNDSVLKIMSQLKASLVHSELTYHKHF